MGSAQDDVVPHIIIRSSRLRPGKIVFGDAKCNTICQKETFDVINIDRSAASVVRDHAEALSIPRLRAKWHCGAEAQRPVGRGQLVISGKREPGSCSA